MNSRLHILNKPPDHPRHGRCLDALEAGDVLVLMESGVLVLTGGTRFPSIPDNVQVYAIGGDLATYSQMPAPEVAFESIDYRGFIELVCRIGSPLNW
jgi:tRNA 2-thiouridine synthesizing protein B